MIEVDLQKIKLFGSDNLGIYMDKTSSRLKKLESYLSRRRSSKAKPKPTPTGCFSVYVGPEKQRFVLRTEYANHPLFRMLLEDAESEYGFCTDGPLLLPCDVDLFCNILAEMEAAPEIEQHEFACGSCSPFNPARRSHMGKAYGLLTPPPLLKINHFSNHLFV